MARYDGKGIQLAVFKILACGYDVNATERERQRGPVVEWSRKVEFDCFLIELDWIGL